MMINVNRFLVIIAALAAFVVPPAAQALDGAALRGPNAFEDNAEQRINYSGKLRMLSQRIPSAACHLMRGIDVEGASQLLVAAPAEFEKILLALEVGDDDLTILNPETQTATLVRIHNLREAWEPMKAAAARVASGTGSEEDLEFILEHNMVVLGFAVTLVSRLVDQYSNPNAVRYDQLLLVDISGRQRMLTQKMSKESCMLGTDLATSETLDHLQGTMRIFENSLFALRDGFAEVGIRPPPNSQIAEGLNLVVEDWSSVKPILDEVLNGADLSDQSSAVKFRRLNQTMSDMNAVVGLYAAAAKPQF